jgi:NAD(P)-dependent dehydrogenase (short-subunit alcohol dehydrogenase family)
VAVSGTRVALVVAGGTGIGAGTARRLAAEGYGVGVLSSSGQGEALARELGGIGVTGSNRSADDLGRLVAAAMDRWGRIDALVNSAAHGPRGPILELADDQWHEGLEIYLLNVVRAARLVTPIMQAQGGGSIVNISTFGAYEPEASFPVSNVVRAGLGTFTKLFADRYAKDGVRMNNVLPGMIEVVHGVLETAEEEDAMKARTPMGRYGTVDEVADLICFLASDRASYITGQNIRVDGGITRSV